MQPKPRTRLDLTSDNRNLDKLGLWGQPPETSGSPVADDAVLTEVEERPGEPRRPVIPRIPDRENSWKATVQTTAGHPAGDRASTDAERIKLAALDHPALEAGQPRQPRFLLACDLQIWENSNRSLNFSRFCGLSPTDSENCRLASEFSRNCRLATRGHTGKSRPPRPTLPSPAALSHNRDTRGPETDADRHGGRQQPTRPTTPRPAPRTAGSAQRWPRPARRARPGRTRTRRPDSS